MKASVKTPLEYGVITLLIFGLCVWQVLSFAQLEDPPVARLAVFGLGLLIAGSMHCVFMMQLVRRTGRSFWPWFVAVVIFMPIGSAVLLALLLGDTDSADS